MSAGAAAGRIELEDLARRVDARFPELTERGRRVALAAHRALAHGVPVPDYGIAAATGLRIEDVRREMSEWPGVYRNESGRLVGFWGLALGETPHRFVVDGRDLYAWCAWDTLFLPELVGRPAQVSSRCAASGLPIELVVTPDAVRDASAPDVVLSFVDPELADVGGDRVISTFCHHILFFASRDHARQWVGERGDEAFALGLQEAFELGRLANLLRYGGELLGRAGHSASRAGTG